MAVFQAAGSFELFTGVEPDRERMLRHFAELAEPVGGALMRRSIATVCLSGTLEEKLAAAAARRASTASSCSRPTSSTRRSRRPRSARRAEDLGLTIDLYQPFRDFEAVPPATARAQPAPRRGQVRRDGAARRADDARLLERLAGRDRRRRARRRAAARAGRRARPSAALQDRLRGARLGPPRQRVRPRVADRRRRRPPGARHLPGLLPHPLARHRPRTRSPRSRARRSSSSSSPTRRT